MIADTVKCSKEKGSKTTLVFVTYTNSINVVKKVKYRVFPHYSKAGVKVVIKHEEDNDGLDYVIEGKRVDERRMTYKDVIENITNLIYL